MIPLWTTTMRPWQSWCGCAFSSLGRPWVAQRVWPMPEAAAERLGAQAVDSRLPSLPTERRRSRLPSLTTAMPAES